MLMQSKVTITAHGEVDLHAEELTVDFSTPPARGHQRQRGNVSDPFIRLEGTLAGPRVAVGAKGAVSGAVTVATGGASGVVAQGLADRARGERSTCKKTTLESPPRPRSTSFSFPRPLLCQCDLP